MKPIAKQLTMGALILVVVTVVSFGIRQVRFSLHRARGFAMTPTTAHSGSPLRAGASGQASGTRQPGDNATRDQLRDAPMKQLNGPADANAFQIADNAGQAGDTGQDAWADAYVMPRKDSGDKADAAAMDKPGKGDYAQLKGAGGLQKISLGDNETVYITETGEHWYVSKQPDGSVTKVPLQVENRNGEVVVVGTGEANVYRSGGLQRISMGAGEDVYITETGEHWYVSTQPDGTTTKMQFQAEDP